MILEGSDHHCSMAAKLNDSLHLHVKNLNNHNNLQQISSMFPNNN